MKNIIPIVLILASLFYSCTNKEKIYWEKWDNTSFSRARKTPIALFIYSSLEPSNLKLIKNKKLAQILRSFSLYSINIEEKPFAVRRYGKEIPSISFVDKNGNNFYTISPIKIEKLKLLVRNLKKLSSSKSREIPLSKALDGLSGSLLYPGEEREITETVIKNLKSGNTKNISLDLLSYAYRESGDKELKKILISQLRKKLTMPLVDPILGGMWSKSGQVKYLGEFATLTIELNNVSSYCNDCTALITKITDGGIKYFKDKLKREDELFNSATSFRKPFNLMTTERKLIELIGQYGIKKLEKILSISYTNMERGNRHVLFSNRIASKKVLNTLSDWYDFENLVSEIDNETYNTKNELYSHGNILFARLLAMLSIQDKDEDRFKDSMKLKSKIDETFRTKDSLIKVYPEGSTYLLEQIEYLNLLIDIEDINIAITFSETLIKSFCREWQKVIFCSDLPFEVLKTNTGYFSIPDYSMSLNSKLAFTLLRLYGLTEEKKLFDFAYKLLSAFKNRSKAMMKQKTVDKPLMDYTKALISLYSNPLKAYLILSKSRLRERTKERLIQRLKKQIYSISYPSISLKIINDKTELEDLYTYRTELPKDIRRNSLILCLGKKCQKYSYDKRNITKTIESYLHKNRGNIVRLLPFW